MALVRFGRAVRGLAIARERLPVLDLHLELFVIAVLQVGADTTDDFVRVHGLC